MLFAIYFRSIRNQSKEEHILDTDAVKQLLMLPQMSNYYWHGKNELQINIEYNFDHQMSPIKVNVRIQTIVYKF